MSLLTYLLEGQNLSQFDKMARDGDPKHLGIVGRNLTLIAMNERVKAEAAMAAAVAGVEADARNAIRDAAQDVGFAEREAAHREEAMRASAAKAKPKHERIVHAPDSDEAVDEFSRII